MKVATLEDQQDGSEAAVYYRAYTVGNDGHFVDFLSIEADDDRAAMETVRNCLPDRDVELWQQAREVGRLAPKADA